MILPRSLYNGVPPERRTRVANNPTLLYSWWCTIFCACIIGTRLIGRYIRNERLFREDKIMAASLFPLFARMAFIHVVLIWGTNNADTADLSDPLKIHHREIGAKLVIAARIFYTMLYVDCTFLATILQLTNKRAASGWPSSPCQNFSSA